MNAQITLDRPVPVVSPLQLSGVLSFWDFQGRAGEDLTAQGRYPYRLRERNGPVQRVTDGVFGPQSIWLSGETWLEIPLERSSGLHRHGENTAISLVAWINRYRQPNPTPDEPPPPEAIAGIWNESKQQRQYCLFLNIIVTGGGPGNVSGHVSHLGGPTPGRRYCEDVSAGTHPVPFHEWRMVGFTFDGDSARSYLDGDLDENGALNPYHYPGPLFNARADFTVGSVSRNGEMGNWYRGLLGGLAVYDRALTPQEMRLLAGKRDVA